MLELITNKTMGKTTQSGKTHNYLLKRKSCSLSCVGISSWKKKVAVSKGPSGLTYFDKLKKAQIESSRKFFSFVVFTNSDLEILILFFSVSVYSMKISFIL